VSVVRRSALTTLALLIPLAFAPACGKNLDATTEAPDLVAPAELGDLDDYAAARNAYALMEVGDPGRVELRERLRDFLVGYLGRALDKQRMVLAFDALEQLAGLWTPAELRSLTPDPAISDAALRVYAEVARSGNERPALLALGLAHAFGDAQTKSRTEASFIEVREWIERTAEFADDPRFQDLLDRLLEESTSILPSPFLVEQLAEVYLERYRAAQKAGPLSEARDPRIEFTPYLLARLYLRADDLDAAVAAIDRLASDEATVALRELIAAAAATSADDRAPVYLDQLAIEFIPDRETRLPDEIIRQSWGIVDNLVHRTLRMFPEHAPAHLARARVLRAQQLGEAAIVHYERALGSKTRPTNHDDLYLAWLELAALYQSALEVRAETDVAEAMRMLERVEDFHERAAELWQHRPIEPSVSVAWMTVAAAEFDAGHIASAQQLLERTVAIEPHPAALSLLGLIALRRGDFELARDHLRGIEGLTFVDQIDRYEWQIDSRIRLGEVELLAGNDKASVDYLREALRQLNTLLSYPGLGESLRVEFLLRRAQVFFLFGEIELAMIDYRGARALAPKRSLVYTVPLTFTVVHGHFEQAAEILSAAIAEPEVDSDLRVYFAMWVVDLADRVGRPRPDDALDYLRSYASKDDSDVWLRQLARFGLGELDDGKLEAAASDARQRSEAFFYEGLRRWRSGSKAAGLERMAKVLEQQMLGDFEYEMAQNYLRWNELPKTARAALAGSKP
jgi:tetratricopeptide (TPR) repeat protein